MARNIVDCCCLSNGDIVICLIKLIGSCNWFFLAFEGKKNHEYNVLFVFFFFNFFLSNKNACMLLMVFIRIVFIFIEMAFLFLAK